MTFAEALVIGACGALGFGIVSWWINRREKGPAPKSQSAGQAATQQYRGSAAGSPPNIDDPRAWSVVLGLSAGADLETVTAAYKARMQQYYPEWVAELGSKFPAIAASKSAEIYDAIQKAKGAA